MRRFGHTHSLALGAVLALLIQRNGWLVLVGALLLFAAGVVAGRSWLGIKQGAHAAGSLLAARLATEVERQKNIKAGTMVKVRGVRAKRSELDAEYRRGVIDGMDANR
jgi:hypothetical protein